MSEFTSKDLAFWQIVDDDRAQIIDKNIVDDIAKNPFVLTSALVLQTGEFSSEADQQDARDNIVRTAANIHGATEYQAHRALCQVEQFIEEERRG